MTTGGLLRIRLVRFARGAYNRAPSIARSRVGAKWQFSPRHGGPRETGGLVASAAVVDTGLRLRQDIKKDKNS